MKEGFNEFVKVTQDPIPNTTKVIGYFIAFFDVVMATFAICSSLGVCSLRET